MVERSELDRRGEAFRPGKEVSVTLSSLRGKSVLLAFFPLAFTKVCTQEMGSLSEDYGRFRDANTEVLPISGRENQELLAQVLETHQRSA